MFDPGALDAAIARLLPEDTLLGRTRRVLASCSSTNEEAIAWARAGAPHGALVIADVQTHGRGRMGRSWSSASGESLTLSIVLRPSMPPSSAPPLTLAVGLALSDATRALGVHTHLKWPNDLLADEPNGQRRKLAGVLTEMATSGARIEHVVVGIGLNLATQVFPAELASIATSMLRVSGLAPDRAQAAVALLVALDRRYAAFINDGAPATVAKFRAQADFLGKRVVVRAGDERTEGLAVALDDDGALHVRDDAGTLHRLWAGDVAVLP